MAEPAEPDTRDWTWVLDRACPECGVAAGEIPGAELGTRVRASVARWGEVLRRDDVAVRPAPGVWSPLEYACHVRDVFGVFDGRLTAMLEDDLPTFANWDQDAAALAGEYDRQVPTLVAAELAAHGARLADGYDAVAAEAQAEAEDEDGAAVWQRQGLRSNGSQFTVLTLGQYMLHDVLHHLHDVGA